VQENTGRVVEEHRSSAVVITFKFDEVLVSLVSIVKFLTMMRLNKVITCCSGKQSWDESILHVLYGAQIIDVEVGFALDGA